MDHRPILLSYNTVERMLRGDFFHTVTWETVMRTLSTFPDDWPLLGIGTTNWFRRNGETIIRGTVGQPEVIWSDPEGSHPMQTLNLLESSPDQAGPELLSPSLDDDATQPAFPFLAMGVCQPESSLVWECGACDHLHLWIQEKLEAENIGLAAVDVQATCPSARYASAFYLPLEGLNLEDGYNAADNLKLAEHGAGKWEVSGIYAANPTLQNIISVEGLPLHLHGRETETQVGGHVIQLTVTSAMVRIWPLKDLDLKILNLDQTWRPVRNLSLPGD
ncbi:MAG: hypothetical protein AAF571_12135 [Verrucomicrobiota bacterium]